MAYNILCNMDISKNKSCSGVPNVILIIQMVVNLSTISANWIHLDVSEKRLQHLGSANDRTSCKSN